MGELRVQIQAAQAQSAARGNRGVLQAGAGAAFVLHRPQRYHRYECSTDHRADALLIRLGGRGVITVDDLILRIMSLIGYFDLDPNRVIDLVLEVYEHKLLRMPTASTHDHCACLTTLRDHVMATLSLTGSGQKLDDFLRLIDLFNPVSIVHTAVFPFVCHFA